jgi:hypothetical protein
LDLVMVCCNWSERLVSEVGFDFGFIFLVSMSSPPLVVGVASRCWLDDASLGDRWS